MGTSWPISNFTGVIEQLFADRNKKFATAAELRSFVEGVAQKVNEGITKEDVLVRTHDSDIYPYTRTEKLADEMEKFYADFFVKLNDGTNPRDFAAWVEYRIDLTDHFFADGCGKAAKAIAGWVLIREKQQLPKYRGREEYYTNAPTVIRGTDANTDREQYERWVNYYKSLFTSL